MKHPALNATVAAIALTAAAGVVASTVSPAGAVTPATLHCSTWKQAGTTGYSVRDCAQLVTYSNGRHVKVTAYIKNSGHHNVAVSGYVAASWGQAGSGAPISGVTVAPGHTTTFTRAFQAPAASQYTGTASITVSRQTATVHSSFPK